MTSLTLLILGTSFHRIEMLLMPGLKVVSPRRKNVFCLDFAKQCTHLHPGPSTSTQLNSVSTQLSATPSTLLEPKYRP